MNDTSIPDGFQAVDLDWSDIPSIDWSKQEHVQGKVLGGRYAQYEGHDGPVVSSIIKLEGKEGPCLVWESYQLRDFFAKLRIGDEVFIRADGRTKLGGGRTMNRFTAAVKPHPDRAKHSRALGIRPQPAQRPIQQTLPGLEETPTQVMRPEDFNDDIPF